MKILDITKEQAVQLWLEDEGYVINPVVEELTQKAKENKISREAKSDKPRKKTTRERKPDLEKEGIIAVLANALAEAGYSPEITNKAKLIEFTVNGNSYKVDLIKKRVKK